MGSVTDCEPASRLLCKIEAASKAINSSLRKIEGLEYSLSEAVINDHDRLVIQVKKNSTYALDLLCERIQDCLDRISLEDTTVEAKQQTIIVSFFDADDE
ncbi:MAG: hypothetical protein AAGA53_14765 [Pseudomonadota bacterium]